jgi:hypothetical protein
LAIEVDVDSAIAAAIDFARVHHFIHFVGSLRLIGRFSVENVVGGVRHA